MKRWLLNALTMLSVLLLAATAALWVRSYQKREDSMVLRGGRLRIASHRGWVWVDNDPAFQSLLKQIRNDAAEAEGKRSAPVRQALEEMVKAIQEGRSPPPIPEEAPEQPFVPPPFTPLIHAIHYWVIVVSMAAVLAMLIAIRFLSRPPAGHNICPVCGYDLRASPDRCPECGTESKANCSEAR